MDRIPDKTAVLEALREIWPSRFDVDVEEIDGFFYWSVCRTELQKRIVDAVRELEENHADWNAISELREASTEASNPLTPAERELGRAYLRDMAQLSHIELEALAEIPNFSSWIFGGTPMRMRDAVFGRDTLRCDPPRGLKYWVSRVHLGVLSSSWTGERVERVLRQRVKQSREDDRQWYERIDRDANGIDAGEIRTARVMFEASFHDKGEVLPYPLFEPRFLSDDEYIPGPVVLETPLVSVSVNYPLPCKGVIASLYDLTVIHSNRWNERLVGKETQGEKQTAIRTWAIALLAAGGMKIRHAMNAVDDITEEESPSETRFNVNRRELVARVPEAKPFVYSRRSGGMQNG